jgi:hypothetical protein
LRSQRIRPIRRPTDRQYPLDVTATATALERIFGMRSIREREATIPPTLICVLLPTNPPGNSSCLVARCDICEKERAARVNDCGKREQHRAAGADVAQDQARRCCACQPLSILPMRHGRAENRRTSALVRITDSGRTSRHVRKVPARDSCTAAGLSSRQAARSLFTIQ